MKKLCIYHSRDLDGWMSAAIVKLKFPDTIFIGWDYGDPVPEEDFSYYDQVIIADISFPKEVMQKIHDASMLVWLDHHISAIKEMGTDRDSWRGVQDTKMAACELTWEYFYPNVKMPEIVRLLGRYDCFGHAGTSEEKYVLEFQYGARAEISNMHDAYERLLSAQTFGKRVRDSAICNPIHDKGKVIYEYLRKEAIATYDKRRFDINIDGHVFGCANQERFNPINFGINYHEDGYAGFACFWYVKGKYMFSLYNDDGRVDCSVLAKARGGGGHKGAAGMVLNHDQFIALIKGK